MFDSFKRAFEWWIGGIVEAVLLLVDLFGRRRRRLRLVPAAGGYQLKGPTPKTTMPISIVSDVGVQPHVEPIAAAKLLRGRSVDIGMRAEAVLVRTLDPLPAESRTYLEGIVRHQLERLAPWLSADTLHVSRVAAVGPADPRLSVTVAATSRSVHAPVIAALRHAGAKDLRLVFDGPADFYAVPVDAGAGEIVRRKKVRAGVLATLALILIPAAGGTAYLVQAAQGVQAESDGLQESITARRADLVAAAAGQGPLAGQDVAGIIARKQNAPIAVLALESLSAALPDDTYVSELRLGEGEARLSGVSKSVNVLVPVVEDVPIFSGASFFAPTTRLPGGEGDQFHLGARWLSPAEMRK